MQSRSNESGRHFVLGTDIGGTFTDFVGMADGDDALFVHKRLTTPADPTEAIFAAIGEFEQRYGIRPLDTLTIVHATTLATNLILERKGAKAALVTTAGFRDVLTMRRENRYDDYDFELAYPEPLIPRSLRFEIDERTLARGEVAQSPSESQVRRLAALIRECGAQSVAVCLLHAYANPENERFVAKVLRDAGCRIPTSLSSQVQPEIREYERCSTTAVNAYVQPEVMRYIARFEERLAGKPYRTQLFIMQSNGGYADGRVSGEAPARLVESGPAAGAIAAGHFSRQIQRPQAIAFDMGGTTAKVTTLRDYAPEISPELEVARTHRLKKGSGIPLRCPSVELIEIGAGGGSIASLDGMGGLKVGPDSAGSTPGPVCYGRGGSQPTVTDADLVLGYLDPASFPFALDVQKARQSIRATIAEPLGVETIEAAAGIVDLVTEQMAAATRIHLVEKGLDPRDFTLIAFGGAGPVHAGFIARRLGIRTVVYPVAAGVASAFGLLVAPNTSVATRTFIQPLETLEMRALQEVIAQLQQQAARQIDSEARRAGAPSHSVFLEMRYARQGYDILVPLPEEAWRAPTPAAIRQHFDETYERIFGRLVEAVPVEMTSVRLFAHARPFVAVPVRANVGASAAHRTVSPTRAMYLRERGGFVECPVFTRQAIRARGETEGPLVVQDPETTIVIDTGARVRVDDDGHVIAELP